MGLSFATIALRLSPLLRRVNGRKFALSFCSPTQPGPFKLNQHANANGAAANAAPTSVDVGGHDTSAISTNSTPPEAAAYGTEEAEGTEVAAYGTRGGWRTGEQSGG
jgi:hypothetical protein